MSVVSCAHRLKYVHFVRARHLKCRLQWYICTAYTITLSVQALYSRLFFSPMARQPLGGLGRLIFRGFAMTHFRHTTVGRIPLHEWSASRRDLYLTTHNTHTRQTFMPPAGFESTTPASERLQTHALDRAATGIGGDTLLNQLICKLLVSHHEAELYIFVFDRDSLSN